MVFRWRGARFWLVAVPVVWLASVASYLVGSETVAVVSRVLLSRLVPIYKVDTAHARIAISFDAMWGTSRTDRILEILRNHRVKTTFFLGGNWVDKYPEYVRKIVAEGHEVGNHTYTHPHLNTLSPDQIRWELEENQRRIDALVGRPRVLLFRPPFGEYSDKVIEVADQLGYYTIQWSVDSLDWQNLSAGAIIDRVMRVVGPGDIVLFHNDGANTPDAVERLIPMLRERGFEIVPVSQLIYHSDYIIEPHSGLQRRRPRPVPPAPQRPGPPAPPPGQRPPSR
ncbi:MAG: polysaccharide deacetylase family protein [Limnochordaceae bacterium]|nr:polysaccharide deacetylase family protein [Limnochordaceae bacterium]